MTKSVNALTNVVLNNYHYTRFESCKECFNPMLLLYFKALLKNETYNPGDPWPKLTSSQHNVKINPRHLANFRSICGQKATDDSMLPATYLQVLAFKLHMEILTDSNFPLKTLGIVHLANEVEVRQRLNADSVYSLHASLEEKQLTSAGTQFRLSTTATVGDTIVWRSRSTLLKRHKTGLPMTRPVKETVEPIQTIGLSLPKNLGRHYAKCSGDYNPIHLWSVTANLLGFKQPVAHGMWSKARCLTALSGQLPDKYRVSVNFKKPIFLPAQAELVCDHPHSTTFTDRVAFQLHGDHPRKVHLTGVIEAL